MRTLVFLLLTTKLLSAQNTAWAADYFEQRVLTYQPVQRIGVPDKSYSFGKMVLRETVNQTGNDPNNFNVADYFNVLSALCSLEEPDSLLQLALKKMAAAPSGCDYLELFSDDVATKAKYAPIAGEWAVRLSECTADSKTTSAGDALPSGADPTLLHSLRIISERDQRHRGEAYDSARQRALDAANQHAIDSLFTLHGTYLGTDVVGNDLGHVMWAVIQHSNTEMMGRYLPVVSAAVQEERLPEAPLRMLLDRYYGLMEGYQFFGSQSGFGFRTATGAERAAVLPGYGLD